MSEFALAYVQSLDIEDERVRRVLVVLAVRTPARPQQADPDPIFGLHLHPAELSGVAHDVDLDVSQLEDTLRGMREQVPLDALEHDDGVWEIVYGPSYTNARSGPRSSCSDKVFDIAGINPFTMPGWDQYSTWGYDRQGDYLYAQLYRNSDDCDARPPIWITPPDYLPTSIDGLVAMISSAMVSYELVPPPASVVRMWLTRIEQYG